MWVDIMHESNWSGYYVLWEGKNYYINNIFNIKKHYFVKRYYINVYYICG